MSCVHIDSRALAARAGIPERILLAIEEIESGGSVRAVRFERRLFQERGGNVAGLPDGTGRATVDAAFARFPRGAVESTSWGRYQVLGAHLLAIHGPDPRLAVQAFDSSPTIVSAELLVRWFQHNPRARVAANAGDIATLARLYNGSERWGVRLREALSSGPPVPPVIAPGAASHKAAPSLSPSSRSRSSRSSKGKKKKR
jgi:hypothetical protein